MVIIKYIKQYPSLLIISLFILLLFLANYKSNTFLTGWDNLHPEFNFSLNIKRSFFSVWQEYQGLGLLGGMGHASDLIHQIILLILSYFLPQNLLRYAWTFLMLSLGPIGVYFLLKNIFQSYRSSVISLLGALFYLFNLSTIQAFYVPFETFTAHFAALPWLFLTLLLYYNNSRSKNLLLFAITSFLTTPQSYVPTLFVVYLVCQGILLFILISFNRTKYSLAKITKILLITFATNAFWLLPFAYFSFTNGHVLENAKINQMATPTIFLQNKEFGNIWDVMLLKGFWFNNVEPNLQSNFSYMLAPWREHLANPFIITIGYLFFAVILLGLILSLRKKKAILIASIALFVFSLTMLTTVTPPFSYFDSIFRKIPLLNEAFRFPFTKFSILASLTYSIFFALGIEELMKLVKKLIIVVPFFTVILIIFALPAFQGHLFYDKERLIIPKEYFQTFDFFKKQDPNTRIANFPQQDFWGWSFYRWGYGGSGFLWYGINQPIMDRAFDVWSKTNENYYWEISNALYAKNSTLFIQTLNKYQINWLLLDKNIISPPSPKALFTNELQQMIGQTHQIQKTASFGNLEIYKVELKDNPEKFIFIEGDLPTINSYKWNNIDQGFVDYGNYISISNKLESVSNYFYPFRSLFSGKEQSNQEFMVEDKKNALEFIKTLPYSYPNVRLTIPSFASKERNIAADIIMKKNKDGGATITILLKTPEVFLAQEKIWGYTIEKPLFIIKPNTNYPLNMNINGVTNFFIPPTLKENQVIGSVFLSLGQNNIFVLSNEDHKQDQVQIIQGNNIKSLLDNDTKNDILPIIKRNSTLVVKVPKVADGYSGFITTPNKDQPEQVKNCDNFRKQETSSAFLENAGKKMLRLYSKNGTACISFYNPNLPHYQGYVILVGNNNQKGRGPHFWLLNEDEKFSPIDTFLFSDKKESISTYILSPQESFGRAYSLHFDNISISNDETVNDLGNVSMYPIPYNFLTSLFISNQFIHTNNHYNNSSTYVSHPNESLYIVNASNINKQQFETLILSQSFDPGWKAYQVKSSIPDLVGDKVKSYLNMAFPFIFGEELKEHVLVNNWANGWTVYARTMKQLNNRTIIIIFLPQYLEYIGFVLLGVILVWLFFIAKFDKPN